MKETVCEAFMRLIKDDPRFQEAPPAGLAMVIGGAMPTPQRNLQQLLARVAALVVRECAQPRCAPRSAGL
jgi:hypothetical protein